MVMVGASTKEAGGEKRGVRNRCTQSKVEGARH